MTDFKRNLVTLFSGAGLVQIIPLLLTPLLTRVYGPADFGLLATYTAFVSVLGVVICGRFELTVMHAKNGRELNNLLRVALLVTCILTLGLSVVTQFYAGEIAVLLGKPALVPWLRFSAVPVFSVALVQIYAVYLSREQKYKTLVKGRVLQSGSGGILSAILGAAKSGSAGLLAGYTLGLVLAVAYFFRKIRWSSQGVTLHRMWHLAIRHRQYPLFSAPAALLDAATQSVAVFLLARYYSGEILGYFSQSHRLLVIPLALIGTSVAQAFFQHAAEQRRNHVRLLPILHRTAGKLLLYSLPCFVAFMAFAPDAFELILGSGWRTAGEYGRLVAIAYWIRLGVSPVSSVFLVVNRVKLGALWQLIYFCTSFSVLGAVAYHQVPIWIFFLAYSVHEIFLYGLYFVLAHHACKADDLIRFK